MAYLSPRRNEALVYYRQTLDVEAALGWLERLNAGRPTEARATLFHLVLYAIAVALDERPRMNRFVRGSRLWQRDGVWLSFSAKQAMSEDAPITTVKRSVDPRASFEALVDGVWPPLRARRRGEQTTSDREMGLMLRLPAPIVRGLMGFATWLDERGALPRAMIADDPLFCSAFVANLGSLGLDAGYHHLWQWGTCSIFCVVGRIEAGPAGRRVTLKWTYDERIADGFYAASALEVVRRVIETPPEAPSETG